MSLLINKSNNDFSRRNFIKYSGLLMLSLTLEKFFAACTSWRYSRREIDGFYKTKGSRAIILGSGITGIAIGALLSKIGFNVIVLEAHPNLIGGHARTIEVNGLNFCVGPQYTWNFNPNSNGVGSRILKFLEIEEDNPFQFLDKNGFEEYYLGENEKFSVPMGLDNYRDKLIQEFPSEMDDIIDFFDDLDLLFRSAQYLHDNGLYLENSTSMILELLFSNHISFFEKFRLYKIYDWTLLKLFKKHNLSDKCCRYLYGHGGIFAENFQSVSVGVYAAATGYYHSGATFPVKGFNYLINSMVNVINKNGGQVLLNKKVISSALKQDLLKSVSCKDGTSYEGELFISTISPRNTCDIIDGCSTKQFDYTPSNSLTGIFIGIKSYPDLHKLKRKNFWWQNFPKKIDFNNPDMLALPDYIYLSSSTENGVLQPDTSNQIQAITVFIPANFIQSKEKYNSGYDTYFEFKNIIYKNAIKRIEDIFFPKFGEYVEFYKILTPYDIYQELNAEAGNVYGRKPDPANVLEKIQLIDEVENLFLANASVGQPGIATAFQTAAIFVEKFCGIKI